MAYDKKFREKVMDYLSKGYTIEKAHEVFGVGTTTIKRWKNLQKETGKLEDKRPNRKPYKLCLDQLKAYITENPDSYLHEIAKVFNCQKSTVFYALRRLKITRKKNG
jgi:transposase